MKIGLFTTATPFFFGPYAKQLLYVGEIFKEHDIYFISSSITNNEKSKLISLDDIKKIDFNENTYCKHKNLFDNMKYVNMYTSTNECILLSYINNVIHSFSLDKVIILSDLLKMKIDIHTFKCEVISWFPNHYEPLDNSSLYILRMMNKIITLSDDGYQIVKHKMPHKICQTIPHIIDIKVPDKSVEQIRNEFHIPLEKYLVCIVGGNYEMNYRRSIDTSIMAFEKFYKKNNNAFLYIQSFTFNGAQFVNNLNNIISYLDIPCDSYKINQTKIEYDKILEIYKMADVCIFGSKSEGFGIPNIEAQLCGSSVVTNGFSALKNYTYNGICVPYLQKHYDHIGDGIWSIPSIQGIADALLDLYHNPIPLKIKEKNIENIKYHFGFDRVSDLFTKVIDIKTDAQELVDIIIKVHLNKEEVYYMKVNIETYKNIKDNDLDISNIQKYKENEIIEKITAPLFMFIDMNCNINDSWLLYIPIIYGNENIKPCIVINTDFKENNTLQSHERLFILAETRHLFKINELNPTKIINYIANQGIPIKGTQNVVNIYKNHFIK